MSTWIFDSRRRRGETPAAGRLGQALPPWPVAKLRIGAAFGGLALALAGCMSAPEISGDARLQAVLAGGDVVLRPSGGYCVDADSLSAPSQQGGESGGEQGGNFALIASCESLSGYPLPQRAEPGVMSVSVSGPQVAGLPDAAALAGSLGAELVDAAPDAILLRAGPGAEAGQRPALFWRALFVVNARVVGVALYGPENSPLAGVAGRRVVMQLIDDIRAATPQRPASATDENADGAETL